jgi:hypothetical protein
MILSYLLERFCQEKGTYRKCRVIARFASHRPALSVPEKKRRTYDVEEGEAIS